MTIDLQPIRTTARDIAQGITTTLLIVAFVAMVAWDELRGRSTGR